MMQRIFKQYGRGYDDSPVSIVAQIDGNTVFSGTVPTSNPPYPDSWSGGSDPNTECFSWTEPTANAVTRTLSITVTNGTFQTGVTLAQSDAGNAAAYGPFYEQLVGEVMYGDPFSNVVIGGQSVDRPVNELPGQWNWNIPAGFTLTATVNCNLFPSGNV